MYIYCHKICGTFKVLNVLLDFEIQRRELKYKWMNDDLWVQLLIDIQEIKIV